MLVAVVVDVNRGYSLGFWRLVVVGTSPAIKITKEALQPQAPSPLVQYSLSSLQCKIGPATKAKKKEASDVGIT